MHIDYADFRATIVEFRKEPLPAIIVDLGRDYQDVSELCRGFTHVELEVNENGEAYEYSIKHMRPTIRACDPAGFKWTGSVDEANHLNFQAYVKGCKKWVLFILTEDATLTYVSADGTVLSVDHIDRPRFFS